MFLFVRHSLYLLLLVGLLIPTSNLSSEWHPCPWKRIGIKWSLKVPSSPTHSVTLLVWPDPSPVECGRSTGLITELQKLEWDPHLVDAWLVWKAQARVLPCFRKYLSHQGMALLPFSAFTGAFFFCEIAQILKLLKENELFSRHTSFSLSVK